MLKGAKIHRDKVKNNAFTKILKNIFFLSWGRRDGSGLKSTDCSSREPGLDF